MVLAAGEVFAGFLIEGVLGAGGMGVVYLARHPRLNRRVALKVLNDMYATDERARAAFDREAELAARLDHPNVVAVLDRSSSEEAVLWLAMRLVSGGDARELLARSPGGLPAELAVSLIGDAAAALDYAHTEGVLHRDVKPANLLIESDFRHGPRALLTDFGIARSLDGTVTQTSITASFAYTSPERFARAPADHRADVYSLGCTLHHLLTGQYPFPCDNQTQMMYAHLNDPPPFPSQVRPGLPHALDAVIATALAKDPAQRYPNCAALAAAAQQAVHNAHSIPGADHVNNADPWATQESTRKRRMAETVLNLDPDHTSRRSGRRMSIRGAALGGAALILAAGAGAGIHPLQSPEDTSAEAQPTANAAPPSATTTGDAEAISGAQSCIAIHNRSGMTFTLTLVNPRLSGSWTFAPDETGLIFHNGTAVTSDDFQYRLDIGIRPETQHFDADANREHGCDGTWTVSLR